MPAPPLSHDGLEPRRSPLTDLERTELLELPLKYESLPARSNPYSNSSSSKSISIVGPDANVSAGEDNVSAVDNVPPGCGVGGAAVEDNVLPMLACRAA